MARKIGDYSEDYVKQSTPMKLMWKIIGAVVVLMLVLGAVSFGMGWLKTGTDIISPTNVKAQWQFAYTFDESLKAINANWCSLKAAEDAETDKEIKPQRVTQRLATEQNYDRVKAQYDAQLANAFKAKWVKPSDVPDRAPLLNKNCAN